VFECLCIHFGAIPADQWRARFLAGRVHGADGRPLALDAPYVHGLEVHYFREVAAEATFNAVELVLFRDEHVLVADKPHFLPVMATGRWVEQTLQARLERRLGLGGLVPLHRLDRGTAGLVLLSVNPASRGRYQALFREQRIVKVYEAVAAPLPQLYFPVERRSRLARGEPFFRMMEIGGDENAITRLDVVERGATWWRYRLEPVTGRKHQLRVHMAALGAPIRNDPWYPSLRPETADDPGRPLGLVARGLEFVDPVSGVERCFRSLMPLPAL
jgi:tRNA pseudouridine32 synthase/23S rRNA pseudouridine746 synthase